MPSSGSRTSRRDARRRRDRGNRVLDVGDVDRMLLAELTWPPGTPRAGQSIPVYASVIRHDRGLLLFDTGVGTGSPEVDREWHPRRFPFDAALAGLGHTRSEVIGIVICHLHFDHCGESRLFPGVPIYVQKAEYEATREKDYTVPEWVDFPGARYAFLGGDAEPWPGVHILSTPGHTPGHQSVLVDTDEGGVLLTGQAVYDLAEYEGTVPLEGTDPAYASSVARLRALRPRRVYVSHDERVGEGLAASKRRRSR